MRKLLIPAIAAVLFIASASQVKAQVIVQPGYDYPPVYGQYQQPYYQPGYQAYYYTPGVAVTVPGFSLSIGNTPYYSTYGNYYGYNSYYGPRYNSGYYGGNRGYYGGWSYGGYRR